jgi:alpha-tubulin suppressor-like RCC1 family protein
MPAQGKRVVDVACGEHHVLFITAQGEVYSLGTGVLGALGKLFSLIAGQAFSRFCMHA